MKLSFRDQSTRYNLWRKLDKTMTWLNGQVRSTPKTILNYRDWLDRVSYMIKTRQDNDVIDCIGLVYTKIKTQLSGTI